ncbi:MAG TPA: hypothetical protein VGR97_00510 [Candidatus Acidoferrales bacterium]|nr:hypothetical protein [Candidatus Acidoferrales bacterium]
MPALAAGVANRIFGDEASEESYRSFAGENKELVEILARRLGNEEDLCRVLSGAAYNACYARYLDAGGKRGLITPYLGYIRAMSRHDWSSTASIFLKIEKLGKNILAPIDSMFHLGIFRPLPNNPNERNFYEAVRRLYDATRV